jgi:hypothetical protein
MSTFLAAASLRPQLRHNGGDNVAFRTTHLRSFCHAFASELLPYMYDSDSGGMPSSLPLPVCGAHAKRAIRLRWRQAFSPPAIFLSTFCLVGGTMLCVLMPAIIMR